MFSSQAFATVTGLDPSIKLLSESKNILALPTSTRNEENVPGLVFVGQRQEQVPVRLVIFAGSAEADSVGSLALLKLLVDLDLAPLLAHDYALFCYLSLPQRAKTYFDRQCWNVHWGKTPLPDELLAFDAEPVRWVQADEVSGANISDLPSNAFRLAVRTPWVAETENQIAAIGIALKEVLLQYRSLRNFAKAL